MSKTHKIRPETLDELLELIGDPADILNEKNVFLDLKKALIEKALEGELGHHLGYAKHGKSSQENNVSVLLV
ncbi:IS256 family transposase [Candidatus Bealeia paramacronuclearis]|uniref:IS256 family transposase n=1 Tax=Candidatus Bealeia paramacronuclearis TaxID=1921001 RepID=A0ABZ2C2E4_9PROT